MAIRRALRNWKVLKRAVRKQSGDETTSIVPISTIAAPSLSSLPTELLEQIGPHLNTPAVASLRLSSAHLSRVFTPFLIDSLTIFVAGLGECIKNLVVRKGPSKVIDFVPIPVRLAPFVERLAVILVAWEIADEEHEKWLLVIQAVYEEISKLKYLKHFKVSWSHSTYGRIPDRADRLMRTQEEGLILAALDAARGTLKHLECKDSFLFPTNPASAPPSLFQDLSSLESICFQTFGDHGQGFMSQVQQLLTCSSTLRSIGLLLPIQFSKFVIQDLFTPQFTDLHPHFHSLRLAGDLRWDQGPRQLPLPSLTNLSHLTLIPLNSPEKLDGLWDQLKTNGVRLQYLNLHQSITPSLVSYLTSFVGLKNLLLGTTHAWPSDFSDLLRPVLMSHASCLEVLLLRAPACLYAPAERYGDKGLYNALWPSPSLFQSLKYLSVWGPVGQRYSHNSGQEMLQWLEQFPAMEQVFTEWWAPDNDFNYVMSRLLEDDTIRQNLVGKTGRPKHWAHTDSHPSSGMHHWENQLSSGNEWNFELLSQDRGEDVFWWLSAIWNLADDVF